MKSIRCLIAIAVALTLAASALAGSSPVGTWKGHIVIDASKMTLKDPSQVKMAKQQIAAAEKIQVTLTIKADKTFAGGPPPTTGTWSQKGDTLTLNAKNTATGKTGTQVFTMSKNGKTLTFTQPPNMGILTKIILSR